MILDATIISLKIVIPSVIITLLISMVLVWGLKNIKENYRKYLEGLIIIPMFIPPSAIGYIILIILGKNGIIGNYLYKSYDISIIFTITAGIIASIVVTLPIMYQNIKIALLEIDDDIKNAARDCGANEVIVLTKIILPLGKNGILSGILLSFARAFGEFGATILVAGNIPGKTQTLPMAMYYAIERNNNGEAMKILMIVLITSIFLMSIYNTLVKKKVETDYKSN